MDVSAACAWAAVNRRTASSELPSRLLIMPRVTRLSAPTQTAPDCAASARARCAHSSAAALPPPPQPAAPPPGLRGREQVVPQPLARPGTELRRRVRAKPRPDVAQQLDR